VLLSVSPEDVSLLTALPAWRVWPFDDTAAFEYGRLAVKLMRIG
jgi:hypothetical protein